MSITEPPHQDKDSGGKAFQPRMSDRDAQELRKLDAAVDRIFKAVPDHPYILSVPCDEPRFHYPSRQEAHSWQRHTPFSLDEERLQYMTYIYREPGESCFVVRSQVDEDRDRQKAQYAQKAPSFLSGTNTPSQGTKKKISLSAYKNKLAGGPVEYKEAVPEKQKEKVESKMEGKKVNGVTAGPTPARSQGAAQTPPASGQKKRSHADSNASRSSNDHKGSPHSVKKPRISTTVPPESKSSQGSQSNGAPHDLPPLLSPTFLPVTGHSNWDLPPMLSPTLPPQIEAALLEEVKNPNVATTSNSSATSSPATDKKAKSHVTSTPTPSKIRPPEREKSPPPKVAAPLKPVEKLMKTVPKVIGRKDLERAQTPVRKVTEEPKPNKAEPVESKPSLMVRLRYKKKNRNQVERILRLPPRPNRDHLRAKQITDVKESENARARASSSASQVPDRSSKLEAKEASRSSQPDRPRPTAVAEKRPRAEENDAPPAKRPKGLDLDKKPSTPVHAPLLSPAFIKSGGSGKAPAQATPRNEHLKSVAMNRSISNESNAPTPGGKRTHLTPAGTPLPKTGDKGPTSAPSNGGSGAKAVQLRALNDLSAKYNKLGRKLKHENQAIFEISKDKGVRTDDDRKRAALTGLECILSYMLAYALGDARRRLEGKQCELENTWISLMPLFRHLGGSTRHFKDLSGLHAHLGVAINSRISSAIIERMVKASNPNNPVAADSPQGGPASSEASGGGGHTSNLDPKHLSESWRALGEHSREGAIRLPVEDLTKKFPATWESRGREKDAGSGGGSKDGEERLVGEKGEPLFRGKYFLPISVDTSPIQAVRFGVAFVGEWCKKERVGYEAQVKL